MGDDLLKATAEAAVTVAGCALKAGLWATMKTAEVTYDQITRPNSMTRVAVNALLDDGKPHPSRRKRKRSDSQTSQPRKKQPRSETNSHKDSWSQMARGIETVAKLESFFARRQKNSAGGKVLHIAHAVKVEHGMKLSHFARSQSFNMNPLTAHNKGADTFLFHGAPESAIANIQAEGLSLKFAANGMLGTGIYGAPDPRKSLQYCQNSQNGHFMFVCRFNLTQEKGTLHAGPKTSHRNTVFNEFCVRNEDQVVVLWMIKLKPL